MIFYSRAEVVRFHYILYLVTGDCNKLKLKWTSVPYDTLFLLMWIVQFIAVVSDQDGELARYSSMRLTRVYLCINLYQGRESDGIIFVPLNLIGRPILWLSL